MKHPPLAGWQLAAATFFIAAAAFMQILDVSIANVSIPYISGDLSVSSNQGTWVITSFAVGNAISLPLTGALSKKLGIVRTFILSIALFTFFSWMCGFSFTFDMLVAARFLQGLCAGPLVPLSQSLLILSFPPKKSHIAISFFVTVVVVGPIAGPILGGYITDVYKWNWIFYINVPIGIISGLFCYKLLKARESPIEYAPFDWAGLLLLVMTVGPLQILLDRGEQLDWFSSVQIRVLGALSFISLIAFFIWELTAAHPLIELSFFKDRNFFFGTLVTSFSFAAFFGAIVITPLWLQTQMGYTALWAGLAVAPMGLTPLLFSLAVPKLMEKLSIKFIIFTCFTLFALTYFTFSLSNPLMSFETIALQRLLLGLPLWIYFTPLVAISMSEVPPEKLSSATGLYHFCRIFSGGAGTALYTYLWSRRAIFHHARLSETATSYRPAFSLAVKNLHANGWSKQQALELMNDSLGQQAYAMATNDVFLLSCALCLFLSVFVFFFRPFKKNASQQVSIAD